MAEDYFENVGEEASSSRSIRNIPISSSRSGSTARTSAKRVPQAPRGRSGLLWWIVLATMTAVVAGVVFIGLVQKTEVRVIPRTHMVTFDDTTQYRATLAAGAQSTSGSFVYSYRTEEIIEYAPVASSGSEKIETAASGQITVFNDHSASAVTLIKNTRFETSAGLVFRTRNAVTVPGKSAKGPGSTRITVYADKPGTTYNIGPVEKFVLPGLKESAPEMYPGIYARSDSSMTGGFSGERPIVSEKDTRAAVALLETKVKERVETDTKKSVESTSVLVPSLSKSDLTTLAPEKTDAGVRVGVRAVIRTPEFSLDSFARSLALSSNAEVNTDDSIRITDPTTFSLVPLEGKVAKDEILFKISGKVALVWDVDTQALARALTGKSEASFKNIAESFSGIQEATAAIRPFWRSSFPTNPSSIRITVEAAK